jgi:malate permease and related proteins
MSNQTIDIINRILPILLLLLLGYSLRRINFLSEAVMDGLKKIVVNIALPAVLFLSFLQVEMEPSFFVVFVAVFLLCLFLYGVGRLLKPVVAPQHDYFPNLMTGFEYGMLGISLFGSAHGLQSLPFIAVIGLGHEIFIWFVFLPLLLAKRDGIQQFSDLLKSFIKSPVIIAIFAGLAGSIFGLEDALYAGPVTGGIMATLAFLSNLTIPLILMVVGYGIKLDRAGMGESSRVVIIRLAILIPLAMLINTLLIKGLLGLGQPYASALFVLLILPPPFIIPLFMRKDVIEEKHYVNNTLALYSLVSITIFAVYFALTPTLLG